MKDEKLSERDLRILEEIARERNITQRELSKRARVSLGMVNISLKKLAKKGYIKIRGMNKRSFEYILTPKGFSEKAKKSYRYFLHTLSSLKEMKKRVQSVILAEYAKGRRDFVILGRGELAEIVEMSLRSLDFKDINYRTEQHEDKVEQESGWVILSTKKNCKKGKKENWIDLVEILTR